MHDRLLYSVILLITLFTCTPINIVFAQASAEAATESLPSPVISIPIENRTSSPNLPVSKTVNESLPSLVVPMPIENHTQTPSPLNQNAPDVRSLSDLEIMFVSAISLLMLLINFFLYNQFKGFRWILISTPYDLGIKEEKTVIENITKSQRYLTELLVLVGISLIYGLFIVFFMREITLFNTIEKYLIFHVLYVVVRYGYQRDSTCPKCNAVYAAKTVNSYKTPTSTYKKPVGVGNGKSYETREVGIAHRDRVCTVCPHEWHTEDRYDRKIS